MKQGSCAVTLTIYGPVEIVNESFDAVYKATRKRNGCIHWGKYFTATTDDFKTGIKTFNFGILYKFYAFSLYLMLPSVLKAILCRYLKLRLYSVLKIKGIIQHPKSYVS